MRTLKIQDKNHSRTTGGGNSLSVSSTSDQHEWKMHAGQWAAWDSSALVKVVVAGRRWGKSDLGAMWTLAGAKQDDLAGHQSAITWVVAPTFSLTRPLWRKFMRIRPQGWITGTHGTEARPDYFEVGRARIEFKSADDPERLVAEGLRRVWVDEGGTLKEAAWTESLLPTLMDYGAPALLTGTPKGRNWFYRMWLRGNDLADTEVGSFGGTSYENPFMAKADIDRIAREMPERLYRQEIMREFLSDEGAVFRRVRDRVGPLSDRRTMVIGVDLARRIDFTVLHGLDAQGVTTFWQRDRETSWPLQKARILAAATERDALLVVDASGVGDPVVQDLQKAGVTVVPYQFTMPSKQRLIDSLSIAVEQGAITLPDEPVLLNELEAFEFTKTPLGNIRYGAPEGLHDDCVIALGLAWYGLTQQQGRLVDFDPELLAAFQGPSEYRGHF